MSWEGLNSLLNMTAVWTPASLQLVLNGEIVPPGQYCRPSVDAEGNPQLRPDAEAVTTLLKQGASLVANDIDTLTPELAAVAGALEAALKWQGANKSLLLLARAPRIQQPLRHP